MSGDAFGEQYSNAYDALYSEKDYAGEVAVVLEAIKRSSTHPVQCIADWGCGTGGHAVLFAECGYDVVGVDLSPAMLMSARAKIADAGLSEKVTLHQGDVAGADLGAVCDAAVMMFAVLGYQTTNQRVLATLNNVRRHLKAGGIFVADVWHGPAVLTIRPGDRVRITGTEAHQILRATSTTLHTNENIAEVSFRVWAHEGDMLASSAEEMHRMRYFFPQELALLFSMCSFEILSITAFPTLNQATNESTWNALIVARAV